MGQGTAVCLVLGLHCQIYYTVEKSRFLHTDNGDSPESKYRLHTTDMKGASGMKNSSIVNRVYYRQFGLCNGAIHKAVIGYLWADYCMLKTEHYRPISAPGLAIKTFSDRLHLTHRHLKWRYHSSLLSRIRPRNLTVRTNRRAILLKSGGVGMLGVQGN